MQRKTVVSLLLAAAVLALGGCGNQQQDPAGSQGQEEPQAGVAVQVETVSAETIYSENTVSGTVTADGEATVMVAATAKCTAVYAEAGDQVSAGQMLCTLDLSSTLASYQAASISYDSAVQSYQDQAAIFDKQIALYEKNLNDLKALFEIGAASQAEIDAAELNLMTAQATKESTLSQLEAGMQSYRSSMEQLDAVLENVDSQGNVLAPISGTLVSLSATENGYISASMPVAVIDGAEQMKVVVSVSEALVPKLNIGDEADVTVSALDLTFTGAIRSVERAANVQTKLYQVTLSIPEGTAGLLSGMFADVTFHTDTAVDAVVVPAEAIRNSGGSQHVFVVENGDTARLVEVTTGLTGSGVVEITSGLTAGQQLVTVGQAYLEDGDPVRVVSGEE